MAAAPEENLSSLSSRLAELPSLRSLRALPPDEPPRAPEPAPAGAEGASLRVEASADAPPRPRPDREAARFAEGQVLERRSKEWSGLARQLEQHRIQLAAIEAEHDALHEQLARLFPLTQASHRALKAALAARREGNTQANLADIAAANVRAVEEVERLMASLGTQALWFRSTWDLYAQTIRSAERLRARIEGETSA